MAYLSVSGFNCVRGRITLPRVGVWVADVVIEPSLAGGNPPAVGSPVTVSLNDVISFSGTVRRGQNTFGTYLARIVGGAGGFPTTLSPASYLDVPLQMVVTDLLSEIGETLSSQSSFPDLSTNLPFWMRAAGPAYQEMASLVSVVSDTWRIMPDGTTWIGSDQWQTSGMQYELIAYQPNELKMIVYSDAPTILPGQQLSGGGAVSAVEHIIEASRIRTELLFEDAALADLVAA